MKINDIISGIRSASVPFILLIGMCVNFFAFINNRLKVSNAINDCNLRLSETNDHIEEFKSLIQSMPSSFTNSVISLPAEVSSNPAVSVETKVSSSKSVRYLYMIVNGYPAIRYYGRNFSIGSPFGSMDTRIVEIFPDVIHLSDGTILTNEYNPDSQGDYFITDKTKTEIVKNDK